MASRPSGSKWHPTAKTFPGSVKQATLATLDEGDEGERVESTGAELICNDLLPGSQDVASLHQPSEFTAFTWETGGNARNASDSVKN